MEKIDSQKFIMDMLRFSSVAESPSKIINQILQYIGEQLHSDRAYIFEDNMDGTISNSYEWCKDGVSSEMENEQNLPYEGFLEIWYREFEKSHNLVIRNSEEYRTISEPLYQLMRREGVISLVAGPLEINGKCIGFYGVDNPPLERIENVSELLEATECIIATIIKLRNYSRQMEMLATIDQLTGCRNRTALDFAYESRRGANTTTSVIMCDLNGLKRKNDTFGHSAGDQYLCDAVTVLSASFGTGNIYRLGGDEFLVIRYGLKRDELENMMRKAELYSELKKVSFSIGYCYRERVTEPFENLMREADDMMYADKEEYYKTHPKREQ